MMHSPTTPWKAAIGLLIYVAFVMLILCFSGPDYAATGPSVASSAGNPAVGPVSSGATDYAMRGALAYTSTDRTWTDVSRQRGVPVRILVPDGPGPYPVILFSHGLGGSLDSGREWVQHWASHGFIVVSMQHPGSDEGVWRDKPMGQRLSALKAGASAQQLVARALDVHFVVDELYRQRATPLLAKADLTRIGMSGHSFGAVTTQAVAGERYPVGGDALREPRIAAAIAFSPSARGGGNLDERFDAVTVPFMSVTGTQDAEPLMGLGVKPEDRVKPYEHMLPGDKYLLVINGADHMLFNGAPGLRDTRAGLSRADVLAIEPRAFELVKASTLAFWDATLKQDGAARQWLARGGFPTMVADAGRFESK